jgi:hypothetical protein
VIRRETGYGGVTSKFVNDLSLEITFPYWHTSIDRDLEQSIRKTVEVNEI